MSTTPIGMNFTEYLPKVLDYDTQVALKDAMGNETEYAYKSAEADPGSLSFSDIPNISFDQFVEFLKTKPMADPSKGTFYENYTEDELRTFFKNNGGKL